MSYISFRRVWGNLRRNFQIGDVEDSFEKVIASTGLARDSGWIGSISLSFGFTTRLPETVSYPLSFPIPAIQMFKTITKHKTSTNNLHGNMISILLSGRTKLWMSKQISKELLISLVSISKMYAISFNFLVLTFLLHQAFKVWYIVINIDKIHKRHYIVFTIDLIKTKLK